MSNELIKSNGHTPRAIALNPTTLDEVQRYAKLFCASGFFADSRDLAQACVKIMAGMELNFSPIQSMTGIHVIKGKIALGSHLMAAAIVRAGFSYLILEHTEDSCEIEFSKQGMVLGTSSFSILEAQQAGVYKPDSGWTKYPKNMLYARAMSNGAKWYCAEAFGGAAVYVPEELRDSSIEAEIGVQAPVNTNRKPVHTLLAEREAMNAEIEAETEAAENEPVADYEGLVDEHTDRLGRKKDAISAKLATLKKDQIREGEYPVVQEGLELE